MANSQMPGTIHVIYTALLFTYEYNHYIPQQYDLQSEPGSFPWLGPLIPMIYSCDVFPFVEVQIEVPLAKPNSRLPINLAICSP